MASTVFCIANSDAQAERIVGDLKAASFSNNDISALFADTHSTHDFAHEKHTKAPEGAITGALGALLEGYDALLCPTLAIPALPVDLSWTVTHPNGTITSPLQHLMTMPFNIASRCPVLNVPSGFADNGVPTGLQIVARTFDDLTAFRLGAALDRRCQCRACRHHEPDRKRHR